MVAARLLALTGVLAVLPGCGLVQRKAVGMVASTLASSGDVFTRDDDLELVGQAIPFGLKLYESLLDSAPRTRILLIATCSNSHAWRGVSRDRSARAGEADHHDEVERLNARALKVYLRARNYCLRAMEVRFPGIQQSLSKDPAAALAKARKSDVPLLYWTAAAWGSAIALGLDRPELVADMPTVRALAERAIALDDTWAKGALHEMFISLDSLSPALGGSPERARAHFKRRGAAERRRGRAYVPSPWGSRSRPRTPRNSNRC